MRPRTSSTGCKPEFNGTRQSSILWCLLDLRWLAGILLVFGGATASAQDETTNNGEDLTRPLNRFDVRLQYETLPDMDQFHEEFDNRNQETLTLRSDLVFFQKPDQIGLRIDLPIIWNNKPNTENRTGSVQSGLGDFGSFVLHAPNKSIPIKQIVRIVTVFFSSLCIVAR